MRVTITLDDAVGELLRLEAADAHESLSQHIARKLSRTDQTLLRVEAGSARINPAG